MKQNNTKELDELHAGLMALEALLVEKDIITIEELNSSVKKCYSEIERKRRNNKVIINSIGMKPQIKAIYVTVTDMDRAVSFYEEVFESKISSKSDRMSSFDLDNISFLLFDPSFDNEKSVLGNNVVPNIEVEDINIALDFIKSKKCEIVMPLETVDEYLIFQAKDTEGNILEFYQINNKL